MCCRKTLCTTSLFIYRLNYCGWRWNGVMRASQVSTREYSWCTTGYCPQNPNASKQQIFSYCLDAAVSLKSIHTKIGPDIVLLCPTNTFFTNIILSSTSMPAIRLPRSIQTGRTKLLSARLRACRPCSRCAIRSLPARPGLCRHHRTLSAP